MSVKIKIKNIDEKDQKKIYKFLVIQSNFNPFNTFGEPIKINMFYTENSIVRLPYRFACSFYKQIFNQNIDFPKIFEDQNGKFSGKLLPRQIAPFKQAINFLEEYNTVTIALYPGFGKTFIGAMLSWFLNYKTCVLVHRESVGKAWIKTFKSYFTKEINGIKVSTLPNGVDDICWVDNKINKEAKIFICMDGRVDKIPEEIRDSIGTLIIDEAHLFCSESRVKPMLSFSPKFIIAETATPDKSNGMFKMIQTICGNHLIKEINKTPYNFYIIQTEIDYELGESKNIFGDLVNQQAYNDVRNKLIVDILEANKEYKTMIINKLKDHCVKLKEMIEKKGMETSELYGNKKNYETKNILIGTGSKMGVGFDEANFCDDYDGRPSDLLIITYTFASNEPFEQVKGRGMRADNPNVIMFNDNHNITKKHFRQIRKWVKETNGNIIEVKLKDIKDYNLKNIKN